MTVQKIILSSMLLVPVKNLVNAKQRLASVLDAGSRTQLAQAMLFDVLKALAQWKQRPEVCIVTGDPFALDLAHRFNFQIIEDTANLGQTNAIEMATRIVEARGATSTLVIPGDIPLMQTWELEKIFQAAPEQGSVLVPAADRRGTNAAFRSPASLFPLRFGNDSFQPHLSAARATGKPCEVLSLPGIALDIDNPGDLLQLAAAPGETRAQQLVRHWDLAALPQAANQ